MESKAYLAQMLKLVNSPAEAKALADGLAAQAIQTASYAHWDEPIQADRYMTSNGRTSAVALQALVRIEPDNPLIAKSVRWLMDNRRGGFWRTTQETAATIIALTEYLARNGELDSSYAYVLSLNGSRLAEKQVQQEHIGRAGEQRGHSPAAGAK